MATPSISRLENTQRYLSILVLVKTEMARSTILAVIPARMIMEKSATNTFAMAVIKVVTKAKVAAIVPKMSMLVLVAPVTLAPRRVAMRLMTRMMPKTAATTKKVASLDHPMMFPRSTTTIAMATMGVSAIINLFILTLHCFLAKRPVVAVT